MFAPRLFRRKRNPRILHFASLFVTQLLTQFYRPCRTEFHAFSASYTVGFFYLRHVSGTGHIRGVKKLGGTQCITDIHVTVTDCKDFVSTVDVCDLMYESVVLCYLQNLQCLRFIDIASVFLCFHYIICHISDGDTPAFRIVRAALSVGQAGTTAGTRACRVFSLIFVQPVGNMFQIYGFIFHLDRFFHRDNMHTDTGTAFRHERCDLLQRQTGHMFKERSHLRVRVQDVCVHVEKFCTSRYIHR